VAGHRRTRRDRRPLRGRGGPGPDRRLVSVRRPAGRRQEHVRPRTREGVALRASRPRARALRGMPVLHPGGRRQSSRHRHRRQTGRPGDDSAGLADRRRPASHARGARVATAAAAGARLAEGGDHSRRRPSRRRGGQLSAQNPGRAARVRGHHPRGHRGRAAVAHDPLAVPDHPLPTAADRHVGTDPRRRGPPGGRAG
jgi:hypothetical protein